MSSRRQALEAYAFATDLGYAAFVAQGAVLRQMNFAHPSAIAAINALEPEFREHVVDESPLAELEERIKRFVAGEQDDFRDVKLDLGHLSEFQRKVVARLRRVGYGKTVSYGELASLAGSPGAARAVGNTMACNRFPVIIPCHRVINSDGTLGSYSGPRGIVTKDQLLKLEGCHLKPSAGGRKALRLAATPARR